jgi:hypothetical protein
VRDPFKVLDRNKRADEGGADEDELRYQHEYQNDLHDSQIPIHEPLPPAEQWEETYSPQDLHPHLEERARRTGQRRPVAPGRMDPRSLPRREQEENQPANFGYANIDNFRQGRPPRNQQSRAEPWGNQVRERLGGPRELYPSPGEIADLDPFPRREYGESSQSRGPERGCEMRRSRIGGSGGGTNRRPSMPNRRGGYRQPRAGST